VRLAYFFFAAFFLPVTVFAAAGFFLQQGIVPPQVSGSS
jgi:hypothetical protein